MQDLILLLACLLMLSAGFLAPFVMTLGYVWVDTFAPQLISNGVVATIPVALIFGGMAVAIYLVRDRRDPPKVSGILILQLLLAAWVTLTLAWALRPDSALDRWNDVIKVILFSAFIPYVIRTRVQIEAFVLVYLFSITAHLMPWGVKTFITGGGYGLSLGLLRSNSSMLAESSTMAGVGVMIAPLLLVMANNSILLPRKRYTKLIAIAVIIIGLVAAVGTFARTFLIALAVTGGSMWLRAKKKVAFTLAILVMGAILFSVTSDRWTSRASTVTDYQSDNSAYGRVLVWQWTLNFVQSHPFGGGFLTYLTDRIEFPGENGQPPVVSYGKAYHNIFFSNLGDQGFPGFFLYSGLIAACLLATRKARRLTQKLPAHAWCAELAQATQVALLTLVATGFFVDVSYSPILWYLLCICACLRNYAVRVTASALNPGRAVIRTEPVGWVPVATRPESVPTLPFTGRPEPRPVLRRSSS